MERNGTESTEPTEILHSMLAWIPCIRSGHQLSRAILNCSTPYTHYTTSASSILLMCGRLIARKRFTEWSYHKIKQRRESEQVCASEEENQIPNSREKKQEERRKEEKTNKLRIIQKMLIEYVICDDDLV